MKSAETCSRYLCNKYYTYKYSIYIHQVVVLDSRYTPILVYRDTTGITNHMKLYVL